MSDYSVRHGEPPITSDGGTSPIRSDRRSYATVDDNEPSYILWFFIIFIAVTLGPATPRWKGTNAADSYSITSTPGPCQGEADLHRAQDAVEVKCSGAPSREG